MAVSGGKADEEYDVFIVHSAEDNELAEIINKGLQVQKLKTCAYYEEFLFGRSVFDNIRGAIKYSKIILILLTKSALKSHWVRYEVIISLEKAHRENSMCLRLVFVNVTEQERQDFKKGTLELIPDFVVDFNKDTWQEDLVANINAKMTMTDLLPAGNVAHGLVFNYFIGYLFYVLPATKESVQKCEYYDPKRFSLKFFILIPDSCLVQLPDAGSHGDFTIEKMEKPLHISVEHGGKPRTYNPAIYKITEKETSKYYYFTADSPFIMATMSKMKQMGFANIDLVLQVARFRETLTELVQHHNNKHCNNTAAFIRYSDEEGAMALAIWNAVGAELKKPDVDKPVVLTRIRGKMEQPEMTATITFSEQEEDKRVADELRDFLESKHVKFTNGEDKMTVKTLEDSRWNIFVISAEAVKDPVMQFQFDTALEHSVSDNEVQVIPVLTPNTDIKDIPDNFKWAVLLKRDEPDFFDKLWNTTQENRKMTEFIPAGNVFEGLAYAFLINYLPFNLIEKTKSGKDFKERFIDGMKTYKAELLVPKVFVIVPKSCSFPESGKKFDREENLGELEPIQQGFRKWGLTLFRLTLSDGQQVCYSREYATPAVALHQMANDLPFAGITKQEMNEQAFKFASFCQEIMDNELFNSKIGHVKDKCEIVYFDDEQHGKEGVITALEERLKKNIEDGHVLKLSS